MTSNKIALKYGVTVIKVGFRRRTAKWVAFRGGNGTGKPVEDIAEAYNLTTLAARVKKALAK